MLSGGQIITFVILVVFILGLFYARSYVLKKAAGQNWGRLGTKNIIIIERFAIAKDKMFCLVEVCGKVYFVVFAGNAATLLDTHEAAAFYEAAAVPGERNPDKAGFLTAASVATGGSLYARATRGLARFIAKKTGRSATFEEQLAAAIKADEAKRSGSSIPEDKR